MDSLVPTPHIQPDRSKIDLSDDKTVAIWVKHLGVTELALRKAVERVGNSVAAVRKQLAIKHQHD